MTITEFANNRMRRYISGGASPANAARFTRGELEAIYKGNHYSRDNSGAMRVTIPPEPLGIDAAMRKADAAISEYPKTSADISKKKETAPEITKAIYESSAAVRRTISAGIGIKYFFASSKDNDPEAYTTDIEQIADLWNEGKRRYKAFIHGRFLAVDVDRKPGKTDGLETFYRLFPMATLPATLRDLPGSFPCYVLTPSGGFHLYFKYSGPELKLRELAPGVEIKEWQVTCPGSRKENGVYTLHGEFENAPPLYGLIIDAIEEAKRKKEREKEERQKPKHKTQNAANLPAPMAQLRITLDDLAQEAVAAYAGNHDRQVSFAGRACRCKFSGAETLAYVKSRRDIFGSDKDTENTILSVFRDNGGNL